MHFISLFGWAFQVSLHKQAADHRLLPSKHVQAVPLLPPADPPCWMPEQVGRRSAFNTAVQKHSRKKIQPVFQQLCPLENQEQTQQPPGQVMNSCTPAYSSQECNTFPTNLLLQEASPRGNNHSRSSMSICRVPSNLFCHPSLIKAYRLMLYPPWPWNTEFKCWLQWWGCTPTLSLPWKVKVNFWK